LKNEKLRVVQESKVEKTLEFDERIRPSVMSGCKTYTIRKGHRHFARNIKIHNHNAIINGYKHYILSTVPLDILIHEGFKTIFDMLRRLQRYYPDITLNTPVTVVEFRIDVATEGSTGKFRPNANLRYTL
jgi:hypothetical protein